MKQTKVDQLVDVLRREVAAVAPGAHVGSVASLMNAIPGGASIGSVIRAVREAQDQGVEVVSLRGSDGGYFRQSEAGTEFAAEGVADEVGPQPAVDFDAVLVRIRRMRKVIGRIDSALDGLEDELVALTDELEAAAA